MTRVHTAKILTTSALAFVFAATSAFALVCPVYLAEDAFIQIFHHVTPASEVTVTSLRQELKVIVGREEAKEFLARMKNLTGEKQVGFGLRDTPPAGKEFVTDTWYWRNFKTLDQEGNTKFRAVLRARLYDEVEEGTLVASLANAKPGNHTPLNPVALAEASPGVVYRKFEFKVGHPYEPESGMSGQIPGVVDKPGIVLPEQDILTLMESPQSFAQNRDRIFKAALTLKTKDGVKPVNSPKILEAMFERVAQLHAHASEPVGPPVVRIRYKREAWQANFKVIDPLTKQETPIPVQITFDREVKLEDFTSNAALEFDQSNFARAANGGKEMVSVVEFKVPLAYATLSDGELHEMGLGALAEMRANYEALAHAQSSVRNSGKQSNGLRQLNPGR